MRWAYWAIRLEELIAHERSASIEYDLWYNKHFVDLVITEEHKRATDSRIERLVSGEQEIEYKRRKGELHAIAQAKGKMKIITQAYEHKMDMLRSIGAMMRTELSNTQQ